LVSAIDREKLTAYVFQLLIAMPIVSDERQEEEDLAGIADLYVIALERFPLFAVKQAAELTLRGKVGMTGGRFRPTPGELALACEREMEFFAKERRSIKDILDASVVEELPEPVRRERAAGASVAELIAGLKNRNARLNESRTRLLASRRRRSTMH
jgi:hypothetical protein